MENIFRRLHMSLSENGTFPCSARVNEAVRDMMETTKSGIPAIPPPNGGFTLFGSSIVLTPQPGFNCHSGEFQFHGNSNLLHPVPNPNFQPQPRPAIPNIFPPPTHGPGAGPSSSCFPQSFASCPPFTEPLTCSDPAVPNIFTLADHGPGAGPSISGLPQSFTSCPRFTESLTSSGPAVPPNPAPGAGPSGSRFPQSFASGSLLIEPLAPSNSSREPVVPSPSLPVDFQPGFCSLSPVSSGSHDLLPGNLHRTCHLSISQAIASNSQVPELSPSGYRLSAALPPDFPVPDPKGKGRMHVFREAAQRKQIRINKNRASASRSRARRRAYTAELEREIQYLTEENERIRKETVELKTLQNRGCVDLRNTPIEQETTRKRWSGRAASPPF